MPELANDRLLKTPYNAAFAQLGLSLVAIHTMTEMVSGLINDLAPILSTLNPWVKKSLWMWRKKVGRRRHCRTSGFDTYG
jgi:hypothetical protein